jgi:lia operon protein LiaG
MMDIDLSVELPEKQWAAATIESGGGNVNVQAVNAGSIKVQTGSGNIEAMEIKAESITLESGSGNIAAERYTAKTLNFQDGNGNVKLKDGESAVQGQTGAGNIHLESERLIHDTSLRAGSGGVTVDLLQEPSSLGVDFQGSPDMADIQWDGIRYELKDEDEGRLKGTFGSGGALLQVRIGSGKFTLE